MVDTNEINITTAEVFVSSPLLATKFSHMLRSSVP